MSIIQKTFGTRPEHGGKGLLYEINCGGMRVGLTEIGASVVYIIVPDKFGGERDVVFGYNNADAYIVNKPHFGCAVGRVANRINGGAFELNGKKYQLEKNDGGIHHLHGGSDGFGKRVWTVLPYDPLGNEMSFQLKSPDGDAGYPGNLTVTVTYTLSNDDILRIGYLAETDSVTVCNLTNHSYFNLEGQAAKDIYGHEMQIFSDKVTSINDLLIPTGDYTDVAGTPLDFRQFKALGKDIEAAGGFDHNYVLQNTDAAAWKIEQDESGINIPLIAAKNVAARVYAPKSGICMEVRTTSPGLQLYTGNFLDGTTEGKDGACHGKHSGFCLETQYFPDSVNHPHFPSCVVTKEKPQRYYTEYAFGRIVKK